MNNNFYNIPADWYNEFDNTFNVSGKIINDDYMNMDNYDMMKDNMMKDYKDMDDYKMTDNYYDKLSLANVREAFLKGNLFNDLYVPYKNYKYGELRANNKKEELLYNVLMYKFVLTELNLYLDNYPNDMKMMELFNKYLMEEKKLSSQYEKNYGPITTDGIDLESNTWKWVKSPWPWEGVK